MKINRIVLLGCLLGPAAWGSQRDEIRVRIQNYAGVSEKLQAKAYAVAERILSEVSVSVQWLDCSPVLGEGMDAGCKKRPGPADLFLRLMPERMATSAGMNTVSLGYALVPKGELGSLAAVFPDKARRKADHSLAKRPSVLGHAIAHEIGHLLLGIAEHSEYGLMQANWSPGQLLRATARPMEFNRRDVRQIQRNVRARLVLSRQRTD